MEYLGYGMLGTWDVDLHNAIDDCIVTVVGMKRFSNEDMVSLDMGEWN